MKKLRGLWLCHHALGEVSGGMRPVPFTILSSSKDLVPSAEQPWWVLVVFYCFLALLALALRIQQSVPVNWDDSMIQTVLWSSLQDQESLDGAGPPFC